jgi:hypothetical protein
MGYPKSRSCWKSRPMRLSDLRDGIPHMLWWPVVLAIALGIVLDRLLYSTPVIRSTVIISMRTAADTRA